MLNTGAPLCAYQAKDETDNAAQPNSCIPFKGCTTTASGVPTARKGLASSSLSIDGPDQARLQRQWNYVWLRLFFVYRSHVFSLALPLREASFAALVIFCLPHVAHSQVCLARFAITCVSLPRPLELTPARPCQGIPAEETPSNGASRTATSYCVCSWTAPKRCAGARIHTQVDTAGHLARDRPRKNRFALCFVLFVRTVQSGSFHPSNETLGGNVFAPSKRINKKQTAITTGIAQVPKLLVRVLQKYSSRLHYGLARQSLKRQE